MADAFPLSPVPSWYGKAGWQAHSQARNGIFYLAGAPPTVTLSKAGATGYTVRDYDGNIVSSGSLSGAVTSVTPTAPAGGWVCGWYRIYFTGPSSDTLYGLSYAITNFVVLPNDSRFIAAPAGDLNGGGWGVAEYPDLIGKAVLGMGTSRIQIDDVTSPTTGSNTLANALAMAATGIAYWTAPGSQYLDPARTRLLFCQFPNGTVDFATLPNLGGGAAFFRCYVKTSAIDGSTVFVSSAPGTVSGSKITVYHPNNTTVVETFDNLGPSDFSAAVVNAGSAWIKVFSGAHDFADTQAATVIGKTKVAGVTSLVSTLYAAGITRFEGPSNEPTLAPAARAQEAAHQMFLFQAAVHAGNASAKAIGPCPVDIGPDLTGWTAFLAAGGGAFCDEISFHAYNCMTNGDVNLGRSTLAAFFALLTANGLGAVPCWQTESTGAMTPVYGVHHPKRARLQLIAQLLFEQLGIPRERNSPWYDVSHGFWSVPVWWQNGDGSLQPQAVHARTLAAETWGQTHSARLAFPGLADNIFLGSLYNGTSAQTCVLLTTSALPGATVTIATNAAGPLTVVDSSGNTSSVTVTAGAAVIPVREIPTYVRLPIGATCTVKTVNDWPVVTIPDAVRGVPATVDAVAAAALTANTFSSAYGNPGNPGMFYAAGSPPSTVKAVFTTPAVVSRVLVWCGSAWQTDSTLLTFAVETSPDGAAWTTQKTVDVSAGATTFKAGCDSNNTGTELETYWPEQWIFDIPLPAAVTNVLQLRLTVTATSYGGEPTSAATVVGGQGDSNQHVVLQRLSIIGPQLGELQPRTLKVN